MEVKAHRPIRCLLCRADLIDGNEDCLVVKLCTQCGASFVVHIDHCGCVVMKPNVIASDDWV